MSSNTKSARRRRRLERICQRQHSLQASFEKLQQRAETSVNQRSPEPDQPELTPEELAALEEDLIAWGQYFLPHHFKHPPSQMHIEIAAILDAECRRDRELREAAAREAATSNSGAQTTHHCDVLDPEGITAISPGSRSAPGVNEQINPSDPSGVAAISRGSRSAATTPPDHSPTQPTDPGGVAAPSRE